ncbi:MAG: gamma-glutamyl-phosphate reductase, partial [Gordonibacter sp.]
MADEQVSADVRRIAEAAKSASFALAQTTGQLRNAALCAMADALRARTDDIVAANGCDMEAARAAGIRMSLLDRLML